MPRARFGHEPTIVLAEDGSIKNQRIEAYALLLADDVHRATAWKLLGGNIEGGSAVYRKQIETDPVFQQRMRALRAEKELFMADELFGESKWQAAQLWREARNTGNLTLAKQAFDARLKIAEREDERRKKESPAPQDGVAPQGRPGKPPTENPQTYTGMDAIKQKLREMGAPTPGVESPIVTNDTVESQPDGAVTQPPQFAPAVDFQTQLDRLLPG